MDYSRIWLLFNIIYIMRMYGARHLGTYREIDSRKTPQVTGLTAFDADSAVLRDCQPNASPHAGVISRLFGECGGGTVVLCAMVSKG